MVGRWSFVACCDDSLERNFLYLAVVAELAFVDDCEKRVEYARAGLPDFVEECESARGQILLRLAQIAVFLEAFQAHGTENLLWRGEAAHKALEILCVLKGFCYASCNQALGRPRRAKEECRLSAERGKQAFCQDVFTLV